MPMTAYPSMDELIWLFETDPQLEHEDLGWPVSAATFTTTREPWTIEVEIAPYTYTVEIRMALGGTEAVALSMKEVVATAVVDRTHGSEALVVNFDRNSRLDAMRLTLKPEVSVTVDTTRIWEA